MFIKAKNIYYDLLNRCVVMVVLTAFVATTVIPSQRACAQFLGLPVPGSMIKMTDKFMPAIVKGIKVDPNNPLFFNFLIDPGQNLLSQSEKKEEYQKLIKYFLASLTTPEKDMWVNLSPYEHSRIISHNFGQTEMGRDMLAQDYILKQLTASLIYPEDELGKKFWKEIRERVRNEMGGAEVPVNTYNKVWIIPDKATVFEKGNVAMVTESHLKVMLDQDYLSLDKHANADKMGLDGKYKDVSSSSSEVVRKIVLPAIEKEVNEGRNFAELRQMYNSMILASWFKQRLKMHVLTRVYANKDKSAGVELKDLKDNERVYQEYVKAFKKGVYNYVKEEEDPITGEKIPRKYFSGGFAAAMLAEHPVGSSGFNETVLRETPEMPSDVEAGRVDEVSMEATPVGVEAVVQASANVSVGSQEQDQRSVYQKMAEEKLGALLKDYPNLLDPETIENALGKKRAVTVVELIADIQAANKFSAEEARYLAELTISKMHELIDLINNLRVIMKIKKTDEASLNRIRQMSIKMVVEGDKIAQAKIQGGAENEKVVSQYRKYLETWLLSTRSVEVSLVENIIDVLESIQGVYRVNFHLGVIKASEDKSGLQEAQKQFTDAQQLFQEKKQRFEEREAALEAAKDITEQVPEVVAMPMLALPFESVRQEALRQLQAKKPIATASEDVRSIIMLPEKAESTVIQEQRLNERRKGVEDVLSKQKDNVEGIKSSVAELRVQLASMILKARGLIKSLQEQYEAGIVTNNEPMKRIADLTFKAKKKIEKRLNILERIQSNVHRAAEALEFISRNYPGITVAIAKAKGSDNEMQTLDSIGGALLLYAKPISQIEVLVVKSQRVVGNVSENIDSTTNRLTGTVENIRVSLDSLPPATEALVDLTPKSESSSFSISKTRQTPGSSDQSASRRTFRSIIKAAAWIILLLTPLQKDKQQETSPEILSKSNNNEQGAHIDVDQSVAKPIEEVTQDIQEKPKEPSFKIEVYGSLKQELDRLVDARLKEAISAGLAQVPHFLEPEAPNVNGLLTINPNSLPSMVPAPIEALPLPEQIMPEKRADVEAKSIAILPKISPEPVATSEMPLPTSKKEIVPKRLTIVEGKSLKPGESSILSDKSRWSPPVYGRISTHLGDTTVFGSKHQGTDAATEQYTSIFAMHDGFVDRIGDGKPGNGSGFGNWVVVRATDENGQVIKGEPSVFYFNGHMNEAPHVKVGQFVRRGETILGRVGNTGLHSGDSDQGYHDHFAIFNGGSEQHFDFDMQYTGNINAEGILAAHIKDGRFVPVKLEVAKEKNGPVVSSAPAAFSSLHRPVQEAKLEIRPAIANQAMKSFEKGGIDFDPKYLQLNLQGNAMNISVPKGFEWLLNTPIRGFTPQITDIRFGLGFELSFFKGLLTSQQQRNAKAKALMHLASLCDHKFVMKSYLDPQFA